MLGEKRRNLFLLWCCHRAACSGNSNCLEAFSFEKPTHHYAAFWILKRLHSRTACRRVYVRAFPFWSQWALWNFPLFSPLPAYKLGGGGENTLHRVAFGDVLILVSRTGLQEVVPFCLGKTYTVAQQNYEVHKAKEQATVPWFTPV